MPPRKTIKQAKRQYRDKVMSQFNGSDTRRMWKGLQTIADYKRKTSHVTDIDVLLLDTDVLLPALWITHSEVLWALLLCGRRE
jgi:nicotinamide riboside kinase